jgi:hypothetical protein
MPTKSWKTQLNSTIANDELSLQSVLTEKFQNRFWQACQLTIAPERLIAN